MSMSDEMAIQPLRPNRAGLRGFRAESPILASDPVSGRGSFPPERGPADVPRTGPAYPERVWATHPVRRFPVGMGDKESEI